MANENLDPEGLHVGDPVRASPVGAGKVTSITEAGYPRVNEIAVAWVIRTDGATFDPYGHTKKPNFDEKDYYNATRH